MVSAVFAQYANAAYKFEPHIKISEEYNDNIFLADQNEESDYITTVSPGLRLQIKRKYFLADLDYSLNFKKFQSNTALDEEKIEDVQRALMSATFFPENDFTLDLRDQISRVVINDRNPAVAENDFLDKTNLNHFTATPQYRWRALPTFTATLSYRFDLLDYRAPEAQDSVEHRYRLELLKDLRGKRQVGLAGTFTDYRADNNNNDYQVKSATALVTQQFGPRWDLKVEGGYARIELENEVDGRDVTVGSLDLAGEIAKNTALTLNGQRTFVPSADAGVRQRSEASLNLDYAALNQFTLALVAWEDKYLELDRTDRWAGSRLRWGWPLLRHLTLVLSGEALQYDFQPQDEQGLRTGGGASFEYALRKGLISLGYTLRKNDSDIDLNDYTNNIVGLSISLRI